MDIADATVMEGHEGVRLGSYVGKGRDACRVVRFGLQFLNASLCVRACCQGVSPKDESLNKGGALEMGPRTLTLLGRYRRDNGSSLVDRRLTTSIMAPRLPVCRATHSSSCGRTLSKGASSRVSGACLQLHLGVAALVRGVVSDGEQPARRRHHERSA